MSKEIARYKVISIIQILTCTSTTFMILFIGIYSLYLACSAKKNLAIGNESLAHRKLYKVKVTSCIGWLIILAYTTINIVITLLF
jgi:hypothetical protein